MCGIIALILADTTASHVSTELYEALGILQHRGQDAAGIITCGQRGKFFQCKGNGMVRDVFNQPHLEALKGWMGISHGIYI